MEIIRVSARFFGMIDTIPRMLQMFFKYTPIYIRRLFFSNYYNFFGTHYIFRSWYTYILGT